MIPWKLIKRPGLSLCAPYSTYLPSICFECFARGGSAETQHARWLSRIAFSQRPKRLSSQLARHRDSPRPRSTSSSSRQTSMGRLARTARIWPHHQLDTPALSHPSRRYSSQELPHGRSRHPPPGNMKAHEHELFSQEAIRYGKDGFVPRANAMDNLSSISSAEQFFKQGCRFLYSADQFRDHPINTLTPEIVVLGASNVGKSSFLNALMGKPGAARVSKRPGHTTLMNAYGVGPVPHIPRDLVPNHNLRPQHSLVVMDTPGYGFRSQASWGETILRYLGGRRMLRGAVLLLSSEKKLLAPDKWMLSNLAQSNTRTLIVLTKADKSRKDWPEKCSVLAQSVRKEMRLLERSLKNDWKEDSGWTSDVLVTAAHMDITGAVGNGGGVGGARAAILQMAGFDLHGTVEQKPEAIAYTGPVVSFEDIPWKT